MNLRTSLPKPAVRAIRSTYVRVGSLSAAHRIKPDFLLIGGQRCGTTSLFRALEQHPQMVRPALNKGINYFDLNYAKGHRWYAGHFPSKWSAHRRVGTGRPLAFEASGYYLFHPLAARRIAKDLPHVKIVVMLREPMERAFSAWKHERARGYETESFDRALALEAERTHGEAARMTKDPAYQSFSHRHHSYAARSDYVSLLKPYLQLFPVRQIHVLYSETFFKQPDQEFRALTQFLGAESHAGIVFDQHNARRSGPMPEGAVQMLQEKFHGQIEQLEDLVGKRPPWPPLPNS